MDDKEACTRQEPMDGDEKLVAGTAGERPSPSCPGQFPPWMRTTLPAAHLPLLPESISTVDVDQPCPWPMPHHYRGLADSRYFETWIYCGLRE